MSKFQVTTQEADKVRNWFKQGRGCVRWSNLEIGASRPDMITPAMPEGETLPTNPVDSIDYKLKPHWSMGNPVIMLPTDLEIIDRKPIVEPAEWFPVCERCKGSKVRTIAEMAGIWHCSLEDAWKASKGDNWHWGEVSDEGTFPCNLCNGTGHQFKPLIVRLKREWWGGYSISNTAKLKADKLAKRLEKHYGLTGIRVDWEGYNPGYACIVFYTETVEPFTV